MLFISLDFLPSFPKNTMNQHPTIGDRLGEHLYDWQREITIKSNVLPPDTRVNVFVGGRTVGKTALCQWMQRHMHALVVGVWFLKDIRRYVGQAAIDDKDTRLIVIDGEDPSILSEDWWGNLDEVKCGRATNATGEALVLSSPPSIWVFLPQKPETVPFNVVLWTVDKDQKLVKI